MQMLRTQGDRRDDAIGESGQTGDSLGTFFVSTLPKGEDSSTPGFSETSGETTGTTVVRLLPRGRR